MNVKTIAQIGGDGIGPEVVKQGRKAADAAMAGSGTELRWREFPWGAGHYRSTGEILPENAVEELSHCDSIYLGAIGDPSVKPGVLERGILLTLRFAFDMYVNLRPARAFPKVPIPIVGAAEQGIDLLVVRENTEDLYMGLGGTGDGEIDQIIEAKRGLYNLTGHVSMSTGHRMALQMGIATEPAVRRITATACGYAKGRGESSILLATKANAMPHLYGFWEEIAADEAKAQGMAMETMNVDAMCYHAVRRPWEFGTILCPNLFGDIVSDLFAGITGGLGVAAGGNQGDGIGMFEPIHGSAPDIAGTDSANPLAAILSASLMLRSLGEDKGATAIERAVEAFLRESDQDRLPKEMGGQAGTEEIGDSVASIIERDREGKQP